MEYWANGSGEAVLKENVDRDKLRKLLDEVIYEYCSDMEYRFDYMRIYFNENDTHWHEEYTIKFLDALTPYIIEGCAEYHGEDDCDWRYVFKDCDWIDQVGTIYYDVEDMIAELKRKGYVVYKVDNMQDNRGN